MNLYMVPCWLREGSLFRSFTENGNMSDLLDNVVINHVKETSEINSMEDFINVYNFSMYWMLDKLPLDIYVYSFINKKEVLNYLDSKKLKKDIKKNKTLIKYKVLILEKFKNHKLINFLNHVRLNEKQSKYLIYNTGNTSNIAKYFYKEDFDLYSYEDLMKIKTNDITQIQEKDDNSDFSEQDFYEDSDYTENIQKYKPIFIWDNLPENRLSGIYVNSKINILEYINDILKIIDNEVYNDYLYEPFFKSHTKLPKYLDYLNGIIVFKNKNKEYYDHFYFLKKMKYCNFISDPVCSIIDTSPSRTIYTISTDKIYFDDSDES